MIKLFRPVDEKDIYFKQREIQKIKNKIKNVEHDFIDRSVDYSIAAAFLTGSVVGIPILPVEGLIYLTDYVVYKIRDMVLISELRDKKDELGDLELSFKLTR